MKPQNKDKFPKQPKAVAVEPVVIEPIWRPTLRWHLTTLGVIYACLTVSYFVVSYLLSRVPPPYRLRDIPPEITPWLKK